jgi:hypothetical protein
VKAFFAALALAMAMSGCSLFTPKNVLSVLDEAARLLCIQATAEKAGVSAEQVRDTACKTEADWRPFLEAARAGARAGAVKAGMSEPLTPANAEPSLKPVQELEQRK